MKICAFIIKFQLKWLVFFTSWVIAEQGGTRPIFFDKTEKLDLWKFTTRPRPRKSGFWFFERDETETRLSDFYLSKTRPRRDLTQNSGRDRESWCLFLRDRDENHLLIKKKNVNLAKFCQKLLIAIRARPRRDCLNLKQARQDRDKTVPKCFIQDKTETRKVPKKFTRPRQDRESWSFTDINP